MQLENIAPMMTRFLFGLLVTIVLFACPKALLAQTSASVSGSVTDSSGKALQFVTVRLFKTAEPETAMQTVLSSADGRFISKPVDTGSYSISFTHTGFAEQRLTIAVTAASEVKLQPVILTKATSTLGAVVVKVQRPLVEQGDDRIVFNVEDDPASKTETAIDLLRKSPFVTVDGEDNVKINGKSNFKVLLNGKETSMFVNNVKEALRAFPGALISKIEIITNPSAKYDGEGIGGLINIVTKKKVAGYNGTVSQFSRTTDKLNDFSVNANAKIGNFGLSMFYDFGTQHNPWLGSVNTTVPTNPNAYTKRTLLGDRTNKGDWHVGNLELSWDIDTLNTISVYGNVDSWSDVSLSRQTITTDFSNAPSTNSFYNLSNNTNAPGTSIGTDYIRHFKNQKDREFTLKFFGEFSKTEAQLNSDQDNPVTDRFLSNNSKAVNQQYTIQADHTLPITKTGKLETGVKAILRRASSDFESLIKYDANDSYKPEPANTDKFKYAQDVLSVYGMYSFKIKKSSLRLGARVEYTNVDGNFITSNTSVKNHYTTLLPNVQWSNKISNLTTLTLSYNKRLSRPYISDLNPFIFNNDSLNISFGNPDLGPQTIHNVSAQIRYSKGSTFAAANIEGSYSDNKILTYTFYDAVTGISKTTSLNIGKEYQMSLNLNFSTKFTEKWRFGMNGSVRYIMVTNNANTSQKNSGFGGNINFNTGYKFSSKFNVSSYVGIWKDAVTIQSTYPLSTWSNLAFTYKVFKETLSITLKTVNPFQKTWDYKQITKDPNFYNSDVYTQIRRGAVLSLTYNFGKLTENVSKKQGVSNDDLLSKPATNSGG